MPPAREEVLKAISWKGKRVLDAGCGTGELAYRIARRGAEFVHGVDFSKEAIAVAVRHYSSANLVYACADLGTVREKFDVIVSLGTLEHMDNPFACLRALKAMLKPDGQIIVTCPNWTNPRGYMLLTLWYLFRARITLADLHYFTPIEFIGWARKLNMTLSWRTVDQDWAHGEKLIADLTRRLPNVMRDSKLPTTEARIKEFIAWVARHVLPLEKDAPHTGAIGVYHLRKT
ncbi:MAG: 3-demethylubiquinone-9 3-methyltransferase [Parcubacteria group bacterium Greene0714_36]|nr:MAG: 3-demethylubiquinone-9 3-methyltransferase [Parcubacteria group bacterium Greene0714_36]